ncbi:hypothetical protein HHUSO_G3964, partial [Huso huso]
NIQSVSLATIDRVLIRNDIRTKQVHRVPYERNSYRVKEMRYQYVERILELDASTAPQECIFVDEAGFNLSKRRRRGRNVIGHRATVQVPGQRGGNITMCAAISRHGVICHRAMIGPYNTARLLSFLDQLLEHLIPHGDVGLQGQHQTEFIIIWDNVPLHHRAFVRVWFQAHARCAILFLPPFSPFLNPIEEVSASTTLKVYDHHPQEQATLIQAMEAACEDITVEACQGWICHARLFFPRCMARDNVLCDVDENLWPDRNERQGNEEYNYNWICQIMWCTLCFLF